jgi:small subunit ribosomal protein S20
MAHTKSAKKRIVKSEEQRVRNMTVKSRMKTVVKTAMAGIEAKSTDQLNAALSEIDRAATKGVIHPKSAARKKSTLQRLASAIQK